MFANLSKAVGLLPDDLYAMVTRGILNPIKERESATFAERLFARHVSENSFNIDNILSTEIEPTFNDIDIQTWHFVSERDQRDLDIEFGGVKDQEFWERNGINWNRNNSNITEQVRQKMKESELSVDEQVNQYNEKLKLDRELVDMRQRLEAVLPYTIIMCKHKDSFSFIWRMSEQDEALAPPIPTNTKNALFLYLSSVCVQHRTPSNDPSLRIWTCSTTQSDVIISQISLLVKNKHCWIESSDLYHENVFFSFLQHIPSAATDLWKTRQQAMLGRYIVDQTYIQLPNISGWLYLRPWVGVHLHTSRVSNKEVRISLSIRVNDMDMGPFSDTQKRVHMLFDGWSNVPRLTQDDKKVTLKSPHVDIDETKTILQSPRIRPQQQSSTTNTKYFPEKVILLKDSKNHSTMSLTKWADEVDTLPFHLIQQIICLFPEDWRINLTDDMTQVVSSDKIVKSDMLIKILSILSVCCNVDFANLLHSGHSGTYSSSSSQQLSHPNLHIQPCLTGSVIDHELSILEKIIDYQEKLHSKELDQLRLTLWPEHYPISSKQQQQLNSYENENANAKRDVNLVRTDTIGRIQPHNNNNNNKNESRKNVTTNDEHSVLQKRLIMGQYVKSRLNITESDFIEIKTSKGYSFNMIMQISTLNILETLKPIFDVLSTFMLRSEFVHKVTKNGHTRVTWVIQWATTTWNGSYLAKRIMQMCGNEIKQSWVTQIIAPVSI